MIKIESWNDLAKNVKVLVDENEQLRVADESNKEEIKDLKLELGFYKNKCASLSIERDNLEEEAKDLKFILDSVIEGRIKIEEENEKLKKEIGQLEFEHGHYKKDCYDLAAENTQLHEEIKKLNREIKQLKFEKDNLRPDYDTLTRENTQLKNKINSMDLEIESLKDEVDNVLFQYGIKNNIDKTTLKKYSGYDILIKTRVVKESSPDIFSDKHVIRMIRYINVIDINVSKYEKVSDGVKISFKDVAEMLPFLNHLALKNYKNIKNEVLITLEDIGRLPLHLFKDIIIGDLEIILKL